MTRKLKINKITVDYIKSLGRSHQDNARMFSIMDMLTTAKPIEDKRTDTVKYEITYKSHAGVKEYIRKHFAANHFKLEEILSLMTDKGLLVCDYKEKNHYNASMLTVIIDSNFQIPGVYTFTENDGEYKYLMKIKQKELTIKQNIWNDGRIGLLREDLDAVQDHIKNNPKESYYQSLKNYVDILTRRLEGEDINSTVIKTRCGRYYSAFSSFPSELRKKLVDLETGIELACIDNKASQVSFLISVIAGETKNTASQTMRAELEYLKRIQIESSFHDFMSEELSVSREVIKKLIMKLLFGDWRMHDQAMLYSQHVSTENKLKFFDPDTVRFFEEENLNIIDVWNNMVICFKKHFGEVYRYMIGIMKRKSKASIADLTQKAEGRWMRDLQVQLKKLSRSEAKAGRSFQFSTLHDSVYFSAQYFDKVKEIFTEVNKNWEIYHNLSVSVHEHNPLSTAQQASQTTESLITNEETKNEKPFGEKKDKEESYKRHLFFKFDFNYESCTEGVDEGEFLNDYDDFPYVL